MTPEKIRVAFCRGDVRMTTEQLAAIVEKMTPGAWSVLFSDQPIVRGEHGQDVLCVEDCNQADDNARGIVALRNHLPEMMRRYRLMQEALRAADVLLGLSNHDGCSGHRQVTAALAESGKPLEANP